MEKYLTAMFDYRVKKQAIILSIIFFIVDKLTYINNDWYANSYSNHIFFNYLIVLGLLTAIGSKDKIDDERSRLIRYSILKNSIALFVVIFGITALFSGQFGIKSLSMITILYCLQGILVIHILSLFLANKYNPAWLFKETTSPKDYNNLMIGFFYGMYAISAFLIAMSFFIKK
jgi:hypothetical protein